MNWKFYSLVVIAIICVVATLFAAFNSMILPTIVLGVFSLLLIGTVIAIYVFVYVAKYNRVMSKEFKEEFDKF